MIVVPVKEGESIEKALKKFKKKFERTGVVKEIRRRQAYKKPSVEQREEKIKAVYKQGLITDELQS
jgi:small subunit ribosomal protein S21